MDNDQLRSAAATLLRRVGIKKALAADTPVVALSGGERQSIAISRAMQFAARLIILDEPTNNLGVEETRGVLRFVKEMKAAGHSILFITPQHPSRLRRGRPHRGHAPGRGGGGKRLAGRDVLMSRA